MEEPDDIANTMVNELDTFLNTLAPPRVAKAKKNDNNNLSRKQKD